MEKENLRMLAHKILKQQASDTDLSQYLSWYNSLTLVPGGELAKDETLKEAALLARIHAEIKAKQRRHIRNRLSVVAAILIVVLGLGSYLLVYKDSVKPKLQPQQKVVVGNIGPGGNHAILTLSGGKQVLLDAVSDGKIAEQNGSEVSKKSDGLLTYNAASGLTNNQIHYNTLSTPRGGQYQLILSDGTKVILNAASSIRFPAVFSGTQRLVTITGEVYFEVAHNAACPFIVSTNGMQIQVLGTHFNVNAYADDGMTKTTLLKGSVKVIRSGKSKIIVPGEQAAVNAADGDIKVRQVDADNMVAWTRGFLLLQGNSVEEFMTELSRWYNVDIEYKGAVPKNVLGGFISRNNNLSDVLSALEASGVKAELQGRKIIVSSK